MVLERTPARRSYSRLAPLPTTRERREFNPLVRRLARMFLPGARHARSRIMTAAALASQVVASPVGAPIRLAGATRAEITRALADIGVPERELRMRAGQ